LQEYTLIFRIYKLIAFYKKQEAFADMRQQYYNYQQQQMKHGMSQKLTGEISHFEKSWNTTNRSFKDNKARKFETRFYKPLLEEASQGAKWLESVEIEID
jgi:hypothetical protein